METDKTKYTLDLCINSCALVPLEFLLMCQFGCPIPTLILRSVCMTDFTRTALSFKAGKLPSPANE